jgi:predicted metal-binding protein
MLSNIIHAYSEKELPHILTESAGCLKENGVMVIHDFFFEHFPEKAATFDLNMLINTYNGRVFSAKTICEELKSAGLHATPCLPLGSDTGLIVASKRAEVLAELRIDRKAQLTSKVIALGFRNAVVIPVTEIHIPGWTDMRCRHGCGHFGKPNCPPHAPTAEKTRLLLRDYSHALVLEGEPPTRDFQKRILRAEREAFHAGFYKAFAYWAGPCSICDDCANGGKCRNTRDSRPSMEAAGIDVFETMERAGMSVRTLTRKNDFVKYFGLLLLE